MLKGRVHLRSRSLSGASGGLWLRAACVPALAAALLAAGCGSSSKSSSTTSSAAAVTTKSASGTGLSKADCAANKAAGTITYLSPFEYSATPGVIDVFMAQKLGYFKDMCLNVSINPNVVGGAQLVSAGRATATGLASAGTVISQIGTGSNFEGVDTIAQSNPTRIITSSKITNLKQLEGKTLGYYYVLGTTELAMLKAAGVDLSKVKFVSLSNRNPNVIAQGQVDGIVGAAGNQDVALQGMHIPFHEFAPSQFGIEGTAYVTVFNKTFLQKDPTAVQDFVRADLKALQYCLVNGAACVKYLASQAAAANAGQLFSAPAEAASWDYSIKYVKSSITKPLGSQSVAQWTPEYDLLKQEGSLANQMSGIHAPLKLPALSSTLDPSIVTGLYKNGKLTWP